MRQKNQPFQYKVPDRTMGSFNRGFTSIFKEVSFSSNSLANYLQFPLDTLLHFLHSRLRRRSVTFRPGIACGHSEEKLRVQTFSVLSQKSIDLLESMENRTFPRCYCKHIGTSLDSCTSEKPSNDHWYPQGLNRKHQAYS